MKIVRGDCGHTKARWDNHHNCLKCSSSSRLFTCSTCSTWSEETWILAYRRRMHAARKFFMTGKRQNKKKRRQAVTSDLSDDNTLDGNTTPHGFTARGRIHQGGFCLDTEGVQGISPPVTAQPVTAQPGIGQPVTRQPGNGQPGTGQIFTSQPGTGQIFNVVFFFLKIFHTRLPASVAQLDAPSDWRPGGRGFNPRRGRQHSFVEIDHEIFSTVILSPFR